MNDTNRIAKAEVGMQTNRYGHTNPSARLAPGSKQVNYRLVRAMAYQLVAAVEEASVGRDWPVCLQTDIGTDADVACVWIETDGAKHQKEALEILEESASRLGLLG